MTAIVKFPVVYTKTEQTLTPSYIKNPNAGKQHHFQAFRAVNTSGPLITLNS